MLNLPEITLSVQGRKLFGRVAFAFLLLCAIAVGAALGLLFVYASDLPEIRALENYRPNVVTELYSDDGQLIGSFALQRRILVSYEQVPRVLKDAIPAIEDQHFEQHWGIDFPRVAGAAWRNLMRHRITEGASGPVCGATSGETAEVPSAVHPACAGGVGVGVGLECLPVLLLLLLRLLLGQELLHVVAAHDPQNVLRVLSSIR